MSMCRVFSCVVGRGFCYDQCVLLEKLGRYEEAYETAKEYNASFPDDERINRELILLTEIAEGLNDRN